MLVALAVVCGCGPIDDANELAKIKQRKSLAPASAQTTASYSTAEQLFKDGKYIQASDTLNKILIADPENAEAKLLAARCLAANQEYSAALHMTQGIETSASCYDESRDLAAQYAKLGGDVEAEENILLELTHRKPPLKRAIHRLAEIYSQQGRRREAGLMITRLAELRDVTESELFSILTLSNPVFSDVKIQCDADHRLDCLQQARKYRYDADLQGADALMRELALKYPSSTAVAAFQGRIISELADLARLTDWIRVQPKSVEIEPEYWIAVGNGMQQIGDSRQSIRCFLEAVVRDPSDYHSYRQLSKLLNALGQHDSDESLAQRQRYLTEMVDIASRIGGRPGTVDELHQLCKNLLELRRPYEVLGWCKVAAKQAIVSSEMAELQQKAEQMVKGPYDNDGFMQFVCCGLNIQDWPLPDTLELSASAIARDSLSPDVGRGLPSFVFDEISGQSKLSFRYNNSDPTQGKSVYLYQLTGNGIAVIDFDLDGRPDIYCTQGGGDAFKDNNLPNELFRNLGRQFVSVGDSSQVDDRYYGQGIAAADLNQDGFTDLVVANVGPNFAYINCGDGTFSKLALPSAHANGKWTTSIACGDLTGDHLPDIYSVNYVDDPKAFQEPCTAGKLERILDLCSPGRFVADPDEVIELQDNGSYALSSLNETVSQRAQYGFAALIANFDGRNGNDIYVANDVGANLLWLSRESGRKDEFLLQEVADVMGCSYGLLGQRQGSMGLAAADFDANGLIDLYVANYWSQAADLYMLQPSTVFQNEASIRGIYESTRLTVGWGAQSIDIDNDGWQDIVTLNGHVVDHRSRNEPYQQLPQVHRNVKGQFVECNSLQLKGDFWTTPTLGRTLAVLDFDLDGDSDLLASHLDAPLSLLENRTQADHHYLQLEMVGTKSERDAVGARIEVQTSQGSRHYWVTGGDGFLCSNDPVLTIGLGTLTSVNGVAVVWPSGQEQFFDVPAIDNRYLVIEGHADLFQR